jgi:hypothetical protein
MKGYAGSAGDLARTAGDARIVSNCESRLNDTDRSAAAIVAALNAVRM